MKTYDCKWCLVFESVDKRELFTAVRASEKWTNDVLNHSNIIDEHDPSTISASIYVADLDELRDLLEVTKSVKATWGTLLHCCSVESGPLRISASLPSEQANYGCSVTASIGVPERGANELYDSVVEASQKIGNVLIAMREQMAIKT